MWHINYIFCDSCLPGAEWGWLSREGQGDGAISGTDTESIFKVAPPARVPLVPEIRIAGLPDGQSFDGFRSINTDMFSAAPPYWVVPWPGGQALARFVLDNQVIVRGRSVIDLGCGSGLAAISAAKAGAAEVTAMDIDPWALRAVRANAALNGVEVQTLLESFGTVSQGAEIILAGDLWYDRTTGRAATAALTRAARHGACILFGDADRPGRIRNGATLLARYDIVPPDAFGVEGQKTASVYQFTPPLMS